MERSLRVRHPGRPRKRTGSVDVVMVNGQGHVTLSGSSLPFAAMIPNILLLRDPTASFGSDQDR